MNSPGSLILASTGDFLEQMYQRSIDQEVDLRKAQVGRPRRNIVQLDSYG
jgi:hypothetical protein